jgi:hypothetical protein
MRTAGHLSTSPQQRWLPLCPCCGASVDRITRRWHDRVAALVVPSRRYRCANVRCGWQGNLRCV